MTAAMTDMGTGARYGASARAQVFSPESQPRRAAPRADPAIRFRIAYAFVRVRMPRLRPSLRVSDARRAVADLPRLPGREPAEAAVRIRRPLGQPGEVVLGFVDAERALRIVRRPAGPGRLFDELAVR